MTSSKQMVFSGLSRAGLPRAMNAVKRIAGLGTILCLHRVSDDADAAWPPMRVGDFEAFLSYIDQRFEVVSLRRFRQAPRSVGRPRLVLTFDDGYADFVENALPLLRRFGMPAVHNVVVDCVESGMAIWTQRLNHLCAELSRTQTSCSIVAGDETFRADQSVRDLPRLSTRALYAFFRLPHARRLALLDELEARYEVAPPRVRMMGWDDLRTCVENDVEIGSHTMTHALLAGLPGDQLEHEIAGSRRVLAEHLDQPIDTIAFPNGGYDDAVVRSSLAAGYRNLLTVEDRFVSRAHLHDDLLPRLLIDHPSSLENIFVTEGFHAVARGARALLRRATLRGADTIATT